jgi:hypothetical protein
MTVTVTATQVDTAAGWVASGDRDWVPDVSYYRRFHLSCTGSAGEVGTIVLWEIYDSTAVPFVANAATVTVQATGGTYTTATAPAYLNNRNTNTIWVRTAKAADAGLPYYAETGQPWVSALRANGPEVNVELPVTLAWGAAGAKTTTFEIAAYLPGGGRTPASTVSKTVTNPDVVNLK